MCASCAALGAMGDTCCNRELLQRAARFRCSTTHCCPQGLLHASCMHQVCGAGSHGDGCCLQPLRKPVHICTIASIRTHTSLHSYKKGCVWARCAALAAMGDSCRDSEPLRRACAFLLQHQHEDGGWGESYLSCQNKVCTGHLSGRVPGLGCSCAPGSGHLGFLAFQAALARDMSLTCLTKLHRHRGIAAFRARTMAEQPSCQSCEGVDGLECLASCASQSGDAGHASAESTSKHVRTQCRHWPNTWTLS